MSDFARLENMLAKLRQREKAPGELRKLRGPSGDALLASMVAEINETILPRRLIFKTDTGLEFHAAVANRRLQALLSPTPDLPGASEIADLAFEDAKDANLALLGGLLRGAFEKAQTVVIDARRLPAGVFDTDVGAPSVGLVKAWGVQVVEERPKEPSDILDAFLASITEDDAEAWLRIEGENVTDQAGDGDRLAELGEQAAVFLDCYFSKFDALYAQEVTATATVVSPSNDGPTSAVFVEIGGFSAFVAARTARVAALATLWQSQVAE